MKSPRKSSDNFFQIICYCFKTAFQASKLYFCLIVLIDLITLAVPFVSLVLSKQIVNLITLAVQTKAMLVQELLFLAVTVAVINVLSAALSVLRENIQSLHGELIRRDVETELAEKAAGLDLKFFDSYAFYDQLQDSRSNSQFIGNMAFQLLQLGRAAVQLLIAFFMLARLDFLLAVLLLGTSIPSIIANRKVFERLYMWQRDRLNVERRMQYIVGICSDRNYAKDVRLYGLKSRLLQKYMKVWSSWFQEKRTLVYKSTWVVGALKILPEFVSAGILVLIGVRIMQSVLTLGDYALYTGMMSQLSAGLYTGVTLLGFLFQGRIRIANHLKFLGWENSVRDDGTALLETPFTVEFENVSFRYAEQEPDVLHDCSFTIRSGEKTALVGVNGSGKSTIVKLLLRYYDVTGGRILVNGRDIREYTLESLRSVYSVMFQDYPSYAFTVREAVGLREDADVQTALEESGAAEFVDKLPDGADTYLTKNYEESGRELSGGQWQKIALARTLYRDAPYLIMDEPSAALDAQAEHEVFQRIGKRYQGRGILLISHRLSNVMDSDKILVIEEGRAQESGTHAQLMEKNGRYAYLFRLQSENYREKERT